MKISSKSNGDNKAPLRYNREEKPSPRALYSIIQPAPSTSCVHIIKKSTSCAKSLEILVYYEYTELRSLRYEIYFKASDSQWPRGPPGFHSATTWKKE